MEGNLHLPCLPPGASLTAGMQMLLPLVLLFVCVLRIGGEGDNGGGSGK